MCAVNQSPLVGAGITPWVQLLVSMKLPPPLEVQPGVNPEQEGAREKKGLVKPCLKEQVLSEKQQVPELYAPKNGSIEGEGAQPCDGKGIREGA